MKLYSISSSLNALRQMILSKKHHMSKYQKSSKLQKVRYYLSLDNRFRQMLLEPSGYRTKNASLVPTTAFQFFARAPKPFYFFALSPKNLNSYPFPKVERPFLPLSPPPPSPSPVAHCSHIPPPTSPTRPSPPAYLL